MRKYISISLIIAIALVSIVGAMPAVQLSGVSPEIAKTIAENNSLNWTINTNMTQGLKNSELDTPVAIGPWADDADIFLWQTGENPGIPGEPL
jgi:hypothetical protein